MSRIDRLKEYANPMHGPHGAGSDKGNLDYWSERASANSKIAPRAKGGEMKLPSTKVAMRDTSMKPKITHKIDRLMSGKDDLNHVGGTFMPKVRRGKT